MTMVPKSATLDSGSPHEWIFDNGTWTNVHNQTGVRYSGWSNKLGTKTKTDPSRVAHLICWQIVLMEDDKRMY